MEEERIAADQYSGWELRKGGALYIIGNQRLYKLFTFGAVDFPEFLHNLFTCYNFTLFDGFTVNCV